MPVSKVLAAYGSPCGESDCPEEGLRSVNVPVNTILSSEVLDTKKRDITEIAAILNKAQWGIAELEYVVSITVLRQEELLEKDDKRLAAEINFWKDSSSEIVDNLINGVKVDKGDSFKTTLECTFILARSEEHDHCLHVLVNIHQKRSITLTCTPA